MYRKSPCIEFIFKRMSYEKELIIKIVVFRNIQNVTEYYYLDIGAGAKFVSSYLCRATY